jgi:sporulation protein YlmC with PRC-barrel domain
MRKSLGIACAASAVAVFAGWAAMGGGGNAQASFPQYQGVTPYQAYAYVPRTFYPQGGAFYPPAIGTTMPSTGAQFQGGFVQPGAHEVPHAQYGVTSPGAAGVQWSMMQLELAAQQLRHSIQTLAQQPPSEARELALQSAHRALIVTNEALMSLAPRLAEAQFGMPPQPWAGAQWHQQYFTQGPAPFGFAQPQFYPPQHYAYAGAFQPGAMGYGYGAPWASYGTTTWERTRWDREAVAFEAVGNPRDGLLGIEPQRLRNTVSAERLIEADVRGLGGRSVGNIEAIVLANGKVSSVLVRSASLLGTAGEERFRVPWAQLRVSPTAEYVYLPVLTRDEAEKYRKAAQEELRAGEWRLADLLDDGVNLKDGTLYGRVGDVLITQTGELAGVVVRPGRRAPGAQIVVAYDGKVFGRDADTHTLPFEREQLAKLQSFNYVSLALVGPAAYMGARADRIASVLPPAPAAVTTPATAPQVQVKPAETPASPADTQAKPADPQAAVPQPASAAAAAEVKPVLPEPPKPAEPAAKPGPGAAAQPDAQPQTKPTEPRA